MTLSPIVQDAKHWAPLTSTTAINRTANLEWNLTICAENNTSREGPLSVRKLYFPHRRGLKRG